MADFDEYKVFYYVAKNRNITHTAEQLFMTQPAITKAIQRLENELGAKLFLRSQKGVELTGEGKNLYNMIAPPIEGLIDAEKRIAHELMLGNNRVRLCASYHFANVYMPEILVGFKQKYPNITMDVECKGEFSKNPDEYLEEYDLIIGTMPQISEELIKQRRLQEYVLIELQDIMFVGKPLFRLADKEISLNEIADYPLILSAAENGKKETYMELFAKYGKTPNIMGAGGTELRLALLQQGAGILITSEDNGKEEEEEGIIRRLKLIEETPKSAIKMLSKAKADMKPSAVTIQNHILQWFKRI